MKRTLYYSDVTHSCGCIVRYEFSLPKNATKQRRIAKCDELQRMKEIPCTSCEEKRTSIAIESGVVA